MRINVYTEEMLKECEVVVAEYVSRDGLPMKNYGLRIYAKSHPDLHFSPRDDDRSAVTFWCGPKPDGPVEFAKEIYGHCLARREE
jgi:hypothetical protein